MHKNQTLGKYGEDRAAAFLEAQGHKVEVRNWRCAEGEIDLITSKADRFIFTEVKTRGGKGFGHPFEAITQPKLQRMQRLALGWLVTHDCFGCNYSIDIASVLINPDSSDSLEYREGVL